MSATYLSEKDDDRVTPWPGGTAGMEAENPAGRVPPETITTKHASDMNI